MKRFIASIIVLSMLAIDITVDASEYDCELTINANEHDEDESKIKVVDEYNIVNEDEEDNVD